MLTKNEILAELKMRKRDYRQRMREVLQSRKENIQKRSELKTKFSTGSFITCEQINLELQKRIHFIANTATRKISHCSHTPDGDGMA